MITRCPSCNQEYEVEDRFAGQTITCPDCNKVFKVASLPTDQRIPCPICGEMILPTAKKCRFCGEMLNGEIKPRKDAVVYVLLLLFFGFLGVHDIYVGRYYRSIIKVGLLIGGFFVTRGDGSSDGFLFPMIIFGFSMTPLFIWNLIDLYYFRDAIK